LAAGRHGQGFSFTQKNDSGIQRSRSFPLAIWMVYRRPLASLDRVVSELGRLLNQKL
jgi:hypothetical protein